MDFSDSGLMHHAFAVVELDNGLSMIVPVEKLKLTKPGPPENRAQ